MDIKLFFDPVPEEIIEAATGSNSFGQSIAHLGYKDSGLRGIDIVLIGLEDFRGLENDEGFSGGSMEVRKKLYKLKKGHGEYRIMDLGTLRNGVSYDETLLRIKEVCHFLISRNIFPVLIGGSHDLDLGQYQAYENLDKLVGFINVDAFLDIKEGENPTGYHIEKILLHEPNYLFNYSHLAYQSYLIDERSLNTLEKLYFEAYRIGVIRTNMEDMEPVIREGDALSFDVGAIRSSDAPGTLRPQPFGLTGEEACQIAWYAGINEKMTSIGIYEYKSGNDDDNHNTAAIIATMIWYLVEGFYHRKGEKDFKANDYIKYVVSMPSEPETLIFYKSKRSEKWWMEVPLPESSKYHRNFIVPCRYEDYKLATDGEVPDRYITTHARLI